MPSSVVGFVGIAIAAVFAPGAAAAPRCWLVRDGQPQAAIVRGAEDAFAAERLRRWVSDATDVRIDVLVTGQDPLPAHGSIVLVGSAASNPLLRRLAGQHGFAEEVGSLSGQGYLTRCLRHDERDWIVLAGGGRDGALYAVADLMNWHLSRDGRDVWLEPFDTRQEPRFRYRWFWTWDNRMDWGGTGDVVARMGGGAYEKASEAFLVDYKRCVDYMADHKFNGLVLWGFLRDSHGGIEAAQELCRYAAERGVRILPGVGTSGYAGYYYEGKHTLNADTWLAEHPELCSIDETGKPRAAPCPSKRANQDWLDRGAEWLFENFQIGGVNLEMGDFFVCHCKDCKQARAAILSNEPDYYKDMAISHMVTLKTMRRLAPDAWLSYATYTGYSADMMQSPPKFLSMIPQDALCQWTLTRMAHKWPADVRPMAQHNLGYLHWCNESTRTADDFYLEQVQAICRQAADAGIEGLDTYGELPESRPNAELFYLAWEAFLWRPDMSIDEFVDQRLARLYGGRDAARALLEIIPLVQTQKARENHDHCAKARNIAQSARRGAAPESLPRWDRLIASLVRHEQAARQAAEEIERRAAAAQAGEAIALASVSASDEDPAKNWPASKAVDGNVDEPAGYWLTQSNSPQQAWLELMFSRPSPVNRVALFHQLNAGHYRSLDYTISVRAEGQWKRVADIKDNQQAGWVVHAFDTVLASAVRLEITRSAHGSRMGVGEMQPRFVKDER